MPSNNSWLRVLGFILLALLVLGAVAFVAYRIGLNQGAGVLTFSGPQPPSSFSPRGDWFGPRMHNFDGRGYHPMMRFGWHFFHPGFWLGLTALVLIVFLLVKAISYQPTSTQSANRRAQKR